MAKNEGEALDVAAMSCERRSGLRLAAEALLAFVVIVVLICLTLTVVEIKTSASDLTFRYIGFILWVAGSVTCGIYTLTRLRQWRVCQFKISNQWAAWLVLGMFVIILLTPFYALRKNSQTRSSAARPSQTPSAAVRQVDTPISKPGLPSVSVQSGAGHPPFKIADQSPQGDEIIAVVVPEKNSDEDVVKLLWYFRSMVAARRWKDLGIYPPHVLPSGVTTGMFVVYKNAKCAQENDFEKYRDKEPPCGSGDHGVGFYQWGIPTDPTNDEAALTKDGHEQRVFASADDHWKLSDEKTAVKELAAKASGHPIIAYRLIASSEKLFLPDEGLRYAVIKKRPTDEELVDLGLELHKKYPSSKFRIVDSTSGIKDLDAFFDHPLTLEYPQGFASEHFFAMVIWWHQDGKWELIGSDAHPPKGEPIVVLE